MCRKDERTHKHHIIPRYMGGPDTPENLVEVTVTQHAMFHFCNYQLWVMKKTESPGEQFLGK
jgi:hypothetical protein